MTLKIVLIAVGSALFGAMIATLATYTFYTAFVDEMLSGRYVTELAQDVALYKSAQGTDHERLSRLLRLRMAGDLVGLSAQCGRLSSIQKVRAEELFRKVNELGIDTTAILGMKAQGTAPVGCL